MNLISPSNLKNFLHDDCLKDYLEEYHPLPPADIPSNDWKMKIMNRLKEIASALNIPYSEETSILHNLINSECILRENFCCNSTYSGIIDCIIKSSICKQLLPHQTVPSVFSSEWIVFIFIPNDQPINDYIKVKSHIYKQIIYDCLRYCLGKETIVQVVVAKLSYDTIELEEIHYNTRVIDQLISKGIAWRNDLHTQGNRWILEGTLAPPNKNLYPNCTLKYSDQYTHIKEKLAWQWKEVSLLYWIGQKTRTMLHQVGIYNLEHTLLFDYLPTNSNTPIQQAMIKRMFLPIESINIVYSNTNFFDNFIYYDIETSFDNYNKTQVNLVGFFYKQNNRWIYKYFTSKDDSCIKESQLFIKSYLPNHVIVHYTSADCLAIDDECKTYDLYEEIKNNYVTNERIQDLHLNNFKLKSIYKNCCKRLGLINLYDSCKIKNGLEALNGLIKWKTERAAESVIDDIVQYNCVDCIVLAVLHMYLINQYDSCIEEVIAKSDFLQSIKM